MPVYFDGLPSRAGSSDRDTQETENNKLQKEMISNGYIGIFLVIWYPLRKRNTKKNIQTTTNLTKPPRVIPIYPSGCREDCASGSET